MSSSARDANELAAWRAYFEHLRSEPTVNLDAPLKWKYRFEARDRVLLEELSRNLEALGYTNPRVEQSTLADCHSLIIEIVETRTPELMLQRQREFDPLVHREGEGQPWPSGMTFENATKDS